MLAGTLTQGWGNVEGLPALSILDLASNDLTGWCTARLHRSRLGDMRRSKTSTSTEHGLYSHCAPVHVCGSDRAPCALRLGLLLGFCGANRHRCCHRRHAATRMDVWRV
jgi:hypothetical protein